MIYETDDALVLAGTGSNYIAATHYWSHPASPQKGKGIHLRIRKNEQENPLYPAENGYGVYLDKDRWLKLRSHCDALFANDEKNVDIKVNLFDPSPLRKDLEEIKEKLAEVLDDVDDVHDSQSAEIRGLDVKVRALEEKVGSFQSGLYDALSETDTKLEGLCTQVQTIRDWVISLQGDQSKLKTGLRKAAGGFDF